MFSVFVRMHDGGEIDVRACYTAISVSFLSCLLLLVVTEKSKKDMSKGHYI